MKKSKQPRHLLTKSIEATNHMHYIVLVSAFHILSSLEICKAEIHIFLWMQIIDDLCKVIWL